jgi:AraC-like DNA-binding protein
MPPVAYRNYLRTSIAAELLMRTEFSVAEISAKLGFTCSSDFYRAFRKQYGESPSEYRKRKNNPKEE